MRPVSSSEDPVSSSEDPDVDNLKCPLQERDILSAFARLSSPEWVTEVDYVHHYQFDRGKSRADRRLGLSSDVCDESPSGPSAGNFTWEHVTFYIEPVQIDTVLAQHPFLLLRVEVADLADDEGP